MSGTDEATVSYFDSHCHEYGRDRIRGLAKVLRPMLGEGTRLVDVGSGTGTNLARLSKALRIPDLTALDASAESLARVSERLPQARTHCVSILDEQALQPLAGEYDLVVMAAVLHHLVGSTRRESRALAERGLANAARLARPGGLVVVLEPVFEQRGLGVLVRPSGSIFWVKRVVTSVTSRRVPVLGYWNNIGAPVVSFYSGDEVAAMATRVGLDLAHRESREQRPGAIGLVARRADDTFIYRVPLSHRG